MPEDATYTSDVAFTDAVKAIQVQRGSRAGYRKMEERGAWQTKITPDLKAFIEGQTSIFFATASAAGQPYIQHRGGPPGFLRVIDEETIGFADYAGNRQYISLGNLSENPKAYIFLIDYANRQRIKLWGEARVVLDDIGLRDHLMPSGYRARAEQVIVFRVSAWDVNCPQHIPQRFDAAHVAKIVAQRDARIAQLEAELAELRGFLKASDASLG